MAVVDGIAGTELGEANGLRCLALYFPTLEDPFRVIEPHSAQNDDSPNNKYQDTFPPPLCCRHPT